MRQWGKDDLRHLENLGKFLQKARLEMTGSEALGLALAVQFLGEVKQMLIEAIPKEVVKTSLSPPAPQAEEKVVPIHKGKKKK